MPEFTIPLNDAIELTTNWRTYFENLEPENEDYVRAFQIPKEVITALAAMTNADSYRVYLGSDTSASIDASHLKLMFVGIDASGNDILENAAEQSQIYDFTQPCPPCCDVTSPLIGA